MTTTLDSLKTGQIGVVLQVNGFGAVRRRLLDMGLTAGARVAVKKTAPLGDPIEITVRQYGLSIRKSEARNVIVQVRQKKKNCGDMR